MKPPVEVVALIIVAISGVLICWHVVEWRGQQSGQADEDERRFAQRRFRRRLQASGIIGVVGVMIFGSRWVEDPGLAIWYWFGILVLLLWMTALAVGDAISSRNYFLAENRRQISRQLQEIQKAQRENFPLSEGADGD